MNSLDTSRFDLIRLQSTRRLASPAFPGMLRRLAAATLFACCIMGAEHAQGAQPGTSLPAGTIPILKGLGGSFPGANFNSIKTSTGQTLTIEQLVPQLLLDWNSFDIANGSKVQFVMPSSSSVVLNRIHDANPTTIEGQLVANGQVYLLNQNGFLFNRGAQINVNTLIASTLNISQASFQNGIPAVLNNVPYATGTYDNGPTKGSNGPIVLGGYGANASAPELSTSIGGSIILIAPMINNVSGVITSPDGQVILAAGNSAYLSFNAGATSNSLRGLVVQVTAASGPVNLTSWIQNSGTITADRGNVTLAGLAINQNGRVSASSALLENGSIYLQANTLNNTQVGTVTLGAGSVTATPIDTSDTTTQPASQTYVGENGVITVNANRIVDSGKISSPGGSIALTAVTDPVTGALGRIYLAQGSAISAAGDWVDLPASSNFLNFKVTSNELDNSPDQKGGILEGAKVTVNLLVGSSILDLSAYQGNQAQTVAQKADAGGSITLQSTGDIIQRQGSVLDVSGGGVNYAGGIDATTKLLASNGIVYDISTAPEGLTYTAILDSFSVAHPRWGYTESWSNLLYGSSMHEAPYIQGGAGGSLSILPQTGLVLDGTLLGGTTTGTEQYEAPPLAATLLIGQKLAGGNSFGVNDVVFQSGGHDSLGATFGPQGVLTGAQANTTFLSSNLFGVSSSGPLNSYLTTGFGSVSINGNGNVVVPEGVQLTTSIGGSLSLSGNEVLVAGKISAPAGSIALNSVATPGSFDSPVALASVAVGGKAVVSATGTWINNFGLDPASVAAQPSQVNAAGGTHVAAANGGAISVNAPIITLAKGSELDVSSGGSVSARGAVTGGAGGAISINATNTSGSALQLSGELKGYGETAGGSLTINAPSIVVSKGPTSAPLTGTAGTNAPATTGQTTLTPESFQQGGFQNLVLSTSQSLSVAPGTAISPQLQTYQISNARAIALATGGNAQNVTSVVTLPSFERPGVNVTLETQGQLTLPAGSAVVLDPGSKVVLSGAMGVYVDGLVSAPAGSISVGATPQSAPPNPALLEIGSQGALLAAGAFVAQPNSLGMTEGTLLGGGSITFNSDSKHAYSNVVLEKGSRVDVNGAQATIALENPVGNVMPYTNTLESSNAGIVTINSLESVTMDGTLSAHASGSAAGGTFSLALQARGDLYDLTSGRRLVVTENATPAAAGANLLDTFLNPVAIEAGGFDKVDLKAENEIAFSSSQTLHFKRGVTLQSELIEVDNNAQVSLSGAQVTLENPFGQRILDPVAQSNPLSNSLASLPEPTAPGSGSFTLIGSTLDVLGSVTIGGTSSTNLIAAHDLQLEGRVVGSNTAPTGAALIGSLTTSGNLNLQAAQVYPTTQTQFTLAVADGLTGTPTPSGTLTILGNHSLRGDVYSAGGQLNVDAENIIQDGVLEVPLGSLTLNGGTRIDLAPGSLTSVSARGLVIPYGETVAGVNWIYAPTGDDPGFLTALTAPPAKHLNLNAPQIDLEKGAKVDISGGGDVQAVEWVTGSGGKTDVLIQPNTYAIIPSANLSSAPVDPDIALHQNLGYGNDTSVYNGLQIGPGGVVPAGNYVLLPGYYALLPGAYLVQVVPGSTYATLATGSTAHTQSGLTVVPGYMTASGTSVAAQQTVGVIVRPGSAVATLADYTISRSSFFAQQASQNQQPVPPLPKDGGQLTIAATQTLDLSGTIVATLPGASSRAAEVDITASDIALVDHTGRSDIPQGFLQIAAGSLSDIDASLLIGGTRAAAPTGTTASSATVIAPVTSDIIVANSASTALEAPELILVATDSITVDPGSVLVGSGARISPSEDLLIAQTHGSSGALLRLANSGLVSINRGVNPNAAAGNLTIAPGASLSASGSIIADATGATVLNGSVDVAPGGGLELSSAKVSLGEIAGIPGIADGIVLNNAALAGFNQLGTFELKSYGSIDLYGTLTLGSAHLTNLELDAGALVGYAGANGDAANANISAATVSWTNSTGAMPATPNGAGGMLALSAGQISLGAGSKSASGYGTVALSASGAITGVGTGTLEGFGDLDLKAARIQGGAGANQTWVALDDSNPSNPIYHNVTITAAANAAGNTVANAPVTSAGAILEIDGANINDSGAIVTRSGSTTLQALGPAGNITLSSGATIDASGLSMNFLGETALASAGQVTLNARSGAVTLAPGSSVAVNAAAAGGDAGSLSITAQSAQLAGALVAQAPRGEGGSFALNVGVLGSLDTLAAQLDAAGFTGAVNIRARSGDLNLTQSLVAQQISLAADSGTMNISGLLDARAPLGQGAIDLYASTLQISSGAQLLASATSTAADSATAVAPYANGGNVLLVSTTGPLSFASGAVIDVSAGAKGSAGSVLFRAPRLPDNESVAAILDGAILSHDQQANAPSAEVDLEGAKSYTYAGATSIQASDINQYAADNTSFMSAPNLASLFSGVTTDNGIMANNFHVRPAVEVDVVGDVTIASNWDLTAPGWLLPSSTFSGNLEAGTLTVRATGNLTVSNASLGNPDANLVAGSTWNINLTGGADLSAANPLAMQSPAALAKQASLGTAGPGDVVIDSSQSSAFVRTGTGNINIAAGHDFVIDSSTDVNGNLVVGAVYTEGAPIASVNDPYIRFAQGGGNLTITAQHDANGSSNEWITDWLRYPVAGDGDTLGAWWTYLPNFFDGVGALGGGNVTIAAGLDINNLSAMLPTSAILVGPAANPSLQVFDSGNLSVTAGRNITGSEYLVGRGTGTVQAGGIIGANGLPTQFYIMGASDDPALAGSTIKVAAGSDANIQSVNNPTAMYLSISIGNSPGIGSFETANATTSYSSNSEFDVLSKGGSITIGNQPVADAFLNPSVDSLSGYLDSANAIFPARVNLTALAGNITGDPAPGAFETVLYPSTQGQLKLLAADSITNMNYLVSDDADANRTGTEANPAADFLDGASIATGLARIVTSTSTDPFINDVIALTGGITDSYFSFPARARVYADQSILLANASGSPFQFQNLGPKDLSEIVSNEGSVIGGISGIVVTGPGQFLLQAGQDIDLKSAAYQDLGGLVSLGNQTNPDLPYSQGARLTLVAGVSGPINLAGLNPAYQDLIEAGEDKNASAAATAAQLLFGGATIGHGNIDSYLTAVESYAGGSVDLLAPGGGITVGLTAAPSSGRPIGIITNAGGAIDSFLSGDFDINTGKVITEQGGDILIYTTAGDIDAGRGAKTSQSVPPPKRIPLFNGTTFLGFQYLASTGAAGSGIQTVTSKPDGPASIAPPAGSIYLFAPEGTINAGEAGITSGANLFISAQTVLNADNISAAGTAVGVPTVTIGSIASSLSASGATTATGTTNNADQAAAAAAAAAQAAAAAAFTPSILTVDVLGFGEKNCKETDRDCLEKH